MVKRYFLILSTVIILTGSLFSQDELLRIRSAYQRGEISLHEKIVREGYFLFQERGIRKPQEVSGERLPIKCGTGIILGIKTHWNLLSPEEKAYFNQFLQRTDMQHEYVTTQRNFKIHYNTVGNNAIPLTDSDNNGLYDFIEVTAEAFEHSLSFFVDTLGYNPPPPDNGHDGDEYDIYIDALGRGYYGETNSEDPVPGTEGSTSFIRIHNTFNYGHYTTGHDGIRVTAAHELHHAVQFGYSWRYEDSYFHEITSTWFEDVVFDDINDYLQYLPSLFDNLDRPFNTYNGRNEYGMAIWLHFLSKRFNNNIVREIWEKIPQKNSFDAMDEVLYEKNSSFADELSRFALWNYYTGSRADSVNFYEEGSFYPEVKINTSMLTSSDTTFSASVKYLSSKYCEVEIPVMSAFYLNASDDYEQLNNWQVWLIHNDGGLNIFNNKFTFTENSVSDLTLNGYSDYSKFIYIPTSIKRSSNSQGTDGEYKISFQIRLTKPVEIKKNILSGNFPNPFLPENSFQTNIPFILKEKTDVEIRIYNASGKLVKDMYFSDMEAGVYREYCQWNGNDKDGKPVSTGVYLCHLKTESNSDMNKIVLIRK